MKSKQAAGHALAALSDIEQHKNRIEQLLMDSGGELTEEIEAELNQLQVSEPMQVETVVVALDRINADAKYWKERAQAIRNYASGLDTFVERAKDRVKRLLTEQGKDEAIGLHHRIRLSKCQQSVGINEAELPRAYMMQVTTWVPDREKIRADLELGVDITGAELVGGKAIRIYLNKQEDKK
jgi:hypothetical protein